MIRNTKYLPQDVLILFEDRICQLKQYREKFGYFKSQWYTRETAGRANVSAQISMLETKLNILATQVKYLVTDHKRFSLKRLNEACNFLYGIRFVEVSETIEGIRKNLRELREDVEKYKAEKKKKEERKNDFFQMFYSIARVDVFNLRRCQMKAAVKIVQEVRIYKTFGYPQVQTPDFSAAEWNIYNRVIRAAKSMANRMQTERVAEKRYRETDLREQSIEDFMEVV
ncbi:MAG: hypothetical protein UMU13_04875 [Flexistipes sp.]|nr:hypothetical protein [Flexistipes sp.]